MRHLNKIIFINSATIRYQEILLDGNVHFIGTQGVGKSTLLRAILFFYNGDTQKLGIPREKKLFAEYYFPNTNSYILYEVQRESGPFTVLMMRSGTGVQFRFIDAAYDTDFIIRDKRALEQWGDIRQGLDQRGIDSSNRIDRLQEYRDIIYGTAGINPAYQKYALLESKQYQNIPRTITNVFLNTKLEASFIKETIIHSLSEEELQIDLLRYRHHLRDFELEYGNIQTFKKEKTQEHAEKTISSFNEITRSKAHLAQAAAKLGTAAKLAETKQEKLKAKLNKMVEEKSTLAKQQEQKEKRHQDQLNRLKSDVKIFESKIRNANKKEQEYKEKGIAEILQRSARKPEWDSQLSRLLDERQLLTAKFESIEQQFEVQLKQLENSLDKLKNERQTEENAHDKTFLVEKEKLGQKKETELAELAEGLEEKWNDFQKKEKALQEVYSSMREKRSALNVKEWRGEEIQKLKDEKAKAEAHAQNALNTREVHLEKIAQLKKDWEREEEKLTEALDRTRGELAIKTSETQTALEEILRKLGSHRNALYGYLQENYPDWQNTIGRVAKEELLFEEGLEPELKETARLFYGLQLNLEHIDISAKTVEQYELEKKKLEESLRSLNKENTALDTNFKEDSDRLKKRFQPKIREHKDAVQKLTLEREQQEKNVQKKQLELENTLAKAKEEKQVALAQVEAEIAKQEKSIQQGQNQFRDAQQRFQNSKQEAEKVFAKAVKEQQKKLEDKLEEIKTLYREKAAAVEKRRAEVKKQQGEELTKAGADTARLAALDKEITEVDTELAYITKNQELLIEYKKDKRELFDQVADFKKQRARKQEKYELAEQRLAELKEGHGKQLQEMVSTISETKGKSQKIADGFADLETFAQSELYLEAAQWMNQESAETASPYAVRELIQQLRDLSLGLNKQNENLRDATNRFLAGFSEANLFSFQTALTTLADHMAFADGLREFIDENKITEYETRVNERFANILSLVSKETGNLISREGEIQKVISKINGDFRARNFVGVIQSMELKIEDSANRVVKTLKRIREYEQERGFELGERNLFNVSNSSAQNLRAIEFLRQLSRDIAEVKQEQIRLSDAFELRFRVVENENDSGWVEKLSNVGSEGTDVLVKAMINILLLNVFKESASRKFSDFRLHCMMDEIGRLHPTNVRGILKFANDRNIQLINGSPVEQDAMAYRHIYELRKDKESRTRVRRLVTVNENEITQKET